MSVSQPLAPFAALSQIWLSGEAGLVHRLLLTLALQVHPDLYDRDDDERRLLGQQLTALDGDLLLAAPEGPLLLGGLRAVSPLPVSADRRAQDARLLLALDLPLDLREALRARTTGGAGLILRLRGQLTRWTNPLFDEQGYQHTRVGDKGMSRVVQAMGETRSVALQGGERRVDFSAEDWASALR